MPTFNDLWDYSTYTQLIANTFVVLCCFPIHECSHAWIASKLGDHTAERSGRISMNPLRHLDLWGTLLLYAFGMGYAKPVPVNPNNFRNPRKDSAVVYIAGPISNLIMAVLLMFIESTICHITGNIVTGTVISFVIKSLRYAAYVNFQLSVLNLIPIPPLDGYYILQAFINKQFISKYETIGSYSSLQSVCMMSGLIFSIIVFRISLISDITQTLFISVYTLFHQFLH